MESFKGQTFGKFQEAYELWKSQEQQISDAAEPDFCECESQIFIDRESMEPDVIYCDRSYQYVKSHRQRIYRNEGDEVVFTPKEIVFNSLGRCPILIQRRKEGLIQKITSGYGEMSFENFEHELQPDAFRICSQYDGSGKLIITGPTGVGKTHLARAAYLNLIKQFKECIWFKGPELSEVFRRMQSYNNDLADRQEAQRLYDAAINDDCVFIDDLGCERVTASDLFAEQFKLFLESITGGLFITTNFDSTGILARYEAKVTSRLLENAKTVVMTGQDYRRRNFPKTKLEPLSFASGEYYRKVK
jgi:DNA replication protein DnaC